MTDTDHPEETLHLITFVWNRNTSNFSPGLAPSDWAINSDSRTFFALHIPGSRDLHLILHESDPRARNLPHLLQESTLGLQVRRAGLDPETHRSFRCEGMGFNHTFGGSAHLYNEPKEPQPESSPSLRLVTTKPQTWGATLNTLSEREFFATTRDDYSFWLLLRDDDPRARTIGAEKPEDWHSGPSADTLRSLGLDPETTLLCPLSTAHIEMVTEPDPEDEGAFGFAGGEPLTEPRLGRNDLPSHVTLVTEAHRRDIGIITKALYDVAHRREWCGEFDDLLAEVNKELTVKVEPRRKKVRVQTAFTIEVDHTTTDQEILRALDAALHVRFPGRETQEDRIRGT